jgi:CubicO group peptidase (beta-lactamase class C family)
MSPKKTNAAFPFPAITAEEAGFSAERLSRIGPALQKFIDNGKVPNLVTMIVRHGKVVHLDARGYLDIETQKPAGTDAIFRLYSNTKPITGAAAMICVEDGLLNLDDPVSKFIPAFKDQVVRMPGPAGGPGGLVTTPCIRGITVRDCLRNTTGLPSAGSVPLIYTTMFSDLLPQTGLLGGLERPCRTIRETIEAIAKLPLEAQPGTRFDYHLGFPVVGLVLEAVTGKTLEEFYQERIFKPLGMQDSSFYLPKNKLDRFVTLYRPAQQKGKWTLTVAEKPEKSEKVTGPKTYFEAGGAAGGVLSTITDYARFSQMLLNGGELEGVRILGRKSVELMSGSHTGKIPIPMAGPGFGFGLGVGVYLGGEVPVMRSIGAYGWSGAAGTMCFIDPKEDLVCAVFSQVLMHMSMPGNTYPEDFERLAYQSLV